MIFLTILEKFVAIFADDTSVLLSQKLFGFVVLFVLMSPRCQIHDCIKKITAMFSVYLDMMCNHYDQMRTFFFTISCTVLTVLEEEFSRWEKLRERYARGNVAAKIMNLPECFRQLVNLSSLRQTDKKKLRSHNRIHMTALENQSKNTKIPYYKEWLLPSFQNCSPAFWHSR
jgi:hypothetical protein